MTKFCSKNASGLLFAALALCSTTAFASEIATVTIAYQTDASIPSAFDYSISLTDTGTTPLGTYWLGWIPGAGFLTSTPTNVLSPVGWSSKLTNTGTAIQWTTATNPLEPGQILIGFGFTSMETPAQLSAIVASSKGSQPSDVSYVYQGAPPPNNGTDTGFRLIPTVVTPEPPAYLLTLTGVLGIAAFLKRKQIRLS